MLVDCFLGSVSVIVEEECKSDERILILMGFEPSSSEFRVPVLLISLLVKAWFIFSNPDSVEFDMFLEILDRHLNA